MACRPPATASGTWTRKPSSSGASVTTSKEPSARSEKPGSRSDSLFDSKAADEPAAGHALGAARLRGCGGSGDWLVPLLDRLLVLVCPRQPARSGLFQLLRRRETLRHKWRVGRLRHRDAAPGGASDHRRRSLSVHSFALLSPALLHPADRSSRISRLPQRLLRDGRFQRLLGRGSGCDPGQEQPSPTRPRWDGGPWVYPRFLSTLRDCAARSF